MKTWDVVILRYPFADGTEAKQRPALVVTKDEDIHDGGDGLFLLITSNVDRQAKYDVPILDSHTEFRWTGLKKSSCVRVDKVMHLRNSIVCRRLGNLGPDLTQLIREKLAILWAI